MNVSALQCIARGVVNLFPNSNATHQNALLPKQEKGFDDDDGGGIRDEIDGF